VTSRQPLWWTLQPPHLSRTTSKTLTKLMLTPTTRWWREPLRFLPSLLHFGFSFPCCCNSHLSVSSALSSNAMCFICSLEQECDLNHEGRLKYEEFKMCPPPSPLSLSPTDRMTTGGSSELLASWHTSKVSCPLLE
jgi:hypothetical protein